MSTKTWYLDPRGDGSTNELMATEISPEMAQRDVLCHDGVKRDLWQCDYQTVAKFLRYQKTKPLVFRVYYRAYKNGPVILWPFTQKKKMSLKTALEKKLLRKDVK